jgi:hypothetical protein
MPENYYKFEWYRPEYRLRAAEYLHRHETKGALYELLARSADLEVTAPLNDKVDFARHVDRAGLAVVPTLATVSASGMRGQEGGLPAIDLFVKPRTGKGGRGAQRWRYVPGTDGYRCAGRPEVVARHQLARRLADDAAGQELLVQPCLVNHPELADLALDAVVTCRLITIADEVGEPEPVIAIFRMPATPAVVVDNMHRGGLAAPVDIAAGELGPASGYAAAGPATRHARHPVSGGMIVGRKLPLWTDVLGLAVRAHKAFQPRVLVGWDISIGPSGPVLVEGNEQPGVDGLQRLHNLPLGSHRFGQLLGFHLIAPE